MNLWTLSLLCLALAAPPAYVTVEKGESLSEVAARALGNKTCVKELRALNGLTSDKVAEGTQLKLPGPDRPLALAAISAARTALNQSAVNTLNARDASLKLREAETLFDTARYVEAARAADAAWKLLSQSAQAPARFSVEVGERGRTRVKSRSGSPVRVVAQGKSVPVHAGQEVTLNKGEVPVPIESLSSPSLISPLADAQLQLQLEGSGGLYGPVVFNWTPIAGATAYEVDVLSDSSREPVVIRAEHPKARLRGLAPGRYRWSVKALRQDSASDASEPRAFEIVPDTLKLEAHGTGWK